ncbi:hypothetical protein AKJ16_DCAP16606 [Drosera capensis]
MRKQMALLHANFFPNTIPRTTALSVLNERKRHFYLEDQRVLKVNRSMRLVQKSQTLLRQGSSSCSGHPHHHCGCRRVYNQYPEIMKVFESNNHY